jgi:hypothetical protein
MDDGVAVGDGGGGGHPVARVAQHAEVMVSRQGAGQGYPKLGLVVGEQETHAPLLVLVAPHYP